ncbi:hypothetical protein [Sulfolobus acidocaldarius]|uniref:Conserved Archaeal membrane protein n=3 Tax=Sulfolobus acidocaldarius TaxID=2285 RepID=Q4J9F3_SULAC|nr:hypothetical protein [Sulfolobus acidocaldarius]AAY80577.1 conserved Archaeal membrane protein [Sulfolobus acidocaldarius DSM 639]AGE71166.1 hypothetical protein SacN8_06005 [Sulfolobus acidocaldarius N8]ALU28564.1 hypothetical protein ATY89_00345 [Sulfolobus acidocaldarius]ALU31276.1 hypothetical protein ATZ20_03390 [Sulfolobus acidocaldarius]WCM35100.1 hypothetical protein GO597_07020 [Sulfolobus acidocaldarius DSM 639]
MALRYKESLNANISQFLLFLATSIMGANAYLNTWTVVADLVIVTLAGIVLFLDFKEVNERILTYIIYTELALIPIFYIILTQNIWLFLFTYVILGLGIYFRKLKLFSLIFFLASMIYFLQIRVFFGTDSSMISYYSAYLFLHGLNPYNPINTANVYQFYHQNIYLSYPTPILTGGFVTNLNYPSLSFLVLIPAVLLKISPNYVYLTFDLLIGIITFFYLSEKEYALFISAYLIPSYIFYSTGGVTDIVWVFFLLLSLLVKDVKWKGVFYGLSIAYKQTPLAILPFYLISYRKDLKKFLIPAVLVFFLFNGYFILINPSYYIQGVVTPMGSSLLQIGYGYNLLSFTNIFYLYPLFFTVAPILIVVMGLLLFRNKWYGIAYFAFLFLYRVLWNYLIYWPMFCYTNTLNSNDNSGISLGSKSKTIIISMFLLAILGFAFFFHYNFLSYPNSIHIDVLKVNYDNQGYIVSMLLNVSYNGPGSITPLFRILVDSAGPPNGFVWISNSTNLKSGEWEIVNVSAPLPQLYISPDTKALMINAYYSVYQGFLEINL